MNEYPDNIPVGWEELVEYMKQELLQTAQVAVADYFSIYYKEKWAHLM